MLQLLAQAQPDPPTFWGWDPSTTRGMVYGLILIVGTIVALASGPGRLLRGLLKLVGRLLNKLKRWVFGFLRWNVKATLELAGYLGYQGRRVLIFVACIALAVLLAWLFGWWVASKFAAWWLLLALTSRKRRTYRLARRIDKRLDQLEQNLVGQMAGLGKRLAFWQRSAEKLAEGVPKVDPDLPFPTPKPPPPRPEPEPAPNPYGDSYGYL